MNINIINKVLDYIEGHLMEDLTEKGDFTLFSEEEIEFTYNYVKDMDEELIQEFIFYLVFVPYNDLKERIYDELINKYPNRGYEIDKAFYYIDQNPNKSLEMCIELEKKYNYNYELLKRINDIRKLIEKEGIINENSRKKQ